MMHIIQSLSIKSADYIHNIAKYNRSMERPWLWSFSDCVYFDPFTQIDVKLMNIIESLLVCIDSTKNVNIATTYHCWVSISWLRWWAICSVNFVPIIWQKTILINIIHGVMTIPSTKNKHWILEDYSWVPKSIQWLDSVTFNLFPLVFFIFDAAFIHVTKSFLSIISTINKESTIP